MPIQWHDESDDDRMDLTMLGTFTALGALVWILAVYGLVRLIAG